MHISNISEKGVYVQIITKALEYLNKLMTDVQSEIDKLKLPPGSLIQKDKLYLTKYDKDNKWYRAKVVKIESNGQYEILLVDFGIYLRTKAEKLFPLEIYSNILSKYPFQV